MSSSNAGSSRQLKHSITGQTPGLLDPQQPQRLLRTPNSTLSFAAFDPRTASAHRGIPDLRNLSINEELYRPKRVVIETAPNGESFWRFVPRARREDGVVDEGSWPRVVDVCGELVEFSEDQWDIYKLDPTYDCVVRTPPKMSTITRVDVSDRQPVPLDTCTAKRKLSPEVLRAPARSKHKPRKKKELHKRTSWSSSGSSDDNVKDDSEEEYEVEEMVVDDPPLQGAKSSGLGERTKRLRAEIQNSRKMRREKIARADEKLKQRDANENMFTIPENEIYTSPSRGSTMPPPTTFKRKVSTLFESLRSQNNPNFTRPLDEDEPDLAAFKRTRTVSPRTSQRKAAERRQAREKQKKEEMAKRVNGWTQRRHAAFMEQIYADFPQSPVNGTQEESQSGTNEDVHGPPSEPQTNGTDPQEDGSGGYIGANEEEVHNPPFESQTQGTDSQVDGNAGYQCPNEGQAHYPSFESRTKGADSPADVSGGYNDANETQTHHPPFESQTEDVSGSGHNDANVEELHLPPFESQTNGTDPQEEEADQNRRTEDKPSADRAAHKEPEEEPAQELDEEALRQAAIAESRRKLAELEADRPLWEEAAKKRRMSEQAEEASHRAKAEERRRAAERQAEAVRRAKAEQEEREVRERAEKSRRNREETGRLDRERRQRQQRWSTGFWTTSRALERYRDVSDIFDATKFSPSHPLRFEDVPWPVLHQPTRYTVEDVDWTSVERFFDAMKPHMRTQDFNIFVQTSHRRFHPDRWRSRGLLKSMQDEAERGYLEVAANTVAQALTPLWTELKGR